MTNLTGTPIDRPGLMTNAHAAEMRRLADERVLAADVRARLAKLLAEHDVEIYVDAAKAEEIIAWLGRRPVAPTPSVTEKLAPGVYRCQGVTYVVKPTKDGARLYASEIHEISGQRLTQAGETVSFELRYARGMMRHLRLSHRLTLAEAEPLMIRYGRCVCCHRRLKAAESVRAGIGPVCASRYFG